MPKVLVAPVQEPGSLPKRVTVLRALQALRDAERPGDKRWPTIEHQISLTKRTLRDARIGFLAARAGTSRFFLFVRAFHCVFDIPCLVFFWFLIFFISPFFFFFSLSSPAAAGPMVYSRTVERETV